MEFFDASSEFVGNQYLRWKFQTHIKKLRFSGFFDASSEFVGNPLLRWKFRTHSKKLRFSGFFDVSCSSLAEHYLTKICSKYHFEKAPKLFSLLAQLIIYINSNAKRENISGAFSKYILNQSLAKR